MSFKLKNPTGKASENSFSYAISLSQKASQGNPALRVTLLTELATMNAGQVSTRIDALKAIVAGQDKPQQQPADATKQAVPGHYLVDGVEYIVKKSKASGYSYLCNSWGGYLGAKGAAAPILAEIVANGAAHAIAYAKVTGKCGVCNTKLTDPKSIAAGIGPICAKKF